MKKALYVGSFDPCTLGHLDVIARASNLFGDVSVAVGDNPSKKYMFCHTERVNLLKQAVAYLGLGFNNVKVIETPILNLTADYARIHGYDVIIKGARTGQDFDYEKLIHEISLTQQRNLETVLLFSGKQFAHVSSSAAKELAKFQGLVHGYVPINVKAAMERKLGQRIIGVTGTIGSGKSTFCKSLATPTELISTRERPIYHVNMDEIGHELFTSTLPIAEETRWKLKERFGTNDRKELGKLVFGHRAALDDLNGIFREPMLTLLRDKLLGLKGTILLEGALLTEMNWLFLCNNQVVIVKTPSEQEHYNRLSARGLNERQIEDRLQSQYNDDKKWHIATDAMLRDGFGKCVIHDSENVEEDTAKNFVLGNE
jgi:pantetheine-phosphate adenylyltransferase